MAGPSSFSFSSQDSGVNNELLAALASSYSYNQQEREAAFTFLQQCQPLPGFMTSLVEIVGDHRLPVEVRTQSILFFKNSLEKYWRKGTTGGVDPQNKSIIRARLLTLVNEEDRAIAKTTALCVGKIARLDFDQDWPDLFTTLLSTMQQAIEHIDSQPQARLILHRCLLFFQQAAKALSTNRTLRGKLIMGKLAEQSFTLLVQLYRHFFNAAVANISSASVLAAPPPSQPHDLELSLLTFKVLIKLCVYGWGGTNMDSATKQQFLAVQTSFFASNLEDFSTFFSLRKQKLANPSEAAHHSEAMLSLLNRHLLSYGKFYRALLLQNHVNFHSLGATERLITAFWGIVTEAANSPLGLSHHDTDSEDATVLYPEKFVVQCLLFVKSCFTQWPTCRQEFSPPFEPAAFAKDCTQTIISKLLPLTQADLEKWRDDPEEWMKEEDEEKWQFDLRPAAETYLKELAVHHAEVVVPVLRAFKESTSNPQSFEGMLLKEAAYTALGKCPAEMNKVMPFRDLLRSELLPQAQGTDESQLIVRRRIAWLIGCWIGEDASTPDTQTIIYQVLCHLLQKNASTDLAVRLTAARSIGLCDSWDFDVEPFLPFLEVTMLSLARLLEEVSLPETQMKINEVLSKLVQRTGKHIAPYLPLLMQILPGLWATAEKAEDGNPFKSSIMVTFKSLVEALETDSHVLHDAVCHFVQMSCDPTSPSHVVLQEDGLDLWRSTLRFAVAPTPQLLSLAPLLVLLIPDSAEILPRVLSLVDGYSLLAPQSFIPEQVLPILTHLSHLIQHLSEKATKPILSTVDTIIQSGELDPSTGRSTLIPVWASALDASGFFTALVQVIQTDASATVITRYLCTLARIAIADVNVFFGLVQSSATALGVNSEELLKKIIAQWLDRYDNLSYPGQRKLVALAFTNAVRTTSPVILDRIDEIFTIWLSALGETQESANGDSDVYWDGNEYDDDSAPIRPGWGGEVEGNPEVKRLTNLMTRDAMHTVKLTTIISTALEEAQNQNGGAEAFHQKYLADIDQLVLKELVDRLSGLAPGGD